MDRRQFLKGIGATGAVVTLAGCGSDSGNGHGGNGGNGNGGNGNGGNGNGGNGNGESTPTPYVDNKIRFLMSPSEPQDRLRAQYTPIKERLNSSIDAVDNVEMQYANNYAATLTALDSGTGDVAETGPFAAALGVESGNAEILLQRWGYGAWTYSSVIVTRPETDIESLEDLEGKRVAFADPLSASGSLYPMAMIKEAGLSVPNEPGSPAGADFEPSWSTHGQAAEALQAGSVDAAGVGYFIVANDDRSGFVDGVQEVAQDDGIPRAPILVSPQLADDEKQAVQEAFTQADNTLYYGEDGEEGTDDDLWFSKVRPADQSTYQPVIDKAKTLGYGADVFES